jgi:hypothetical protein
MKVGHIMSHNPICRGLQDSVQTVACMLRDHSIGSVSVIGAHESNRRGGLTIAICAATFWPTDTIP